MKKLTRSSVFSLFMFVAATGGITQLAVASDSKDLAKQAQNPISNLISLPLQNNTNFKAGPNERTQNILNVQPVWPFSVSDDWNLITRTILPVVAITKGEYIGDGVIPSPTDQGRIFGLGDTTFTAFFSPKRSGKLTWGVGPVVLVPTANDDALGADEWGLGASAVLLAMPGNWVVGSLFSNIWTQEEDDGSRAVNLFTWQYFINYNIPDSDGLYLTSAPIINANWKPRIRITAGLCLSAAALAKSLILGNNRSTARCQPTTLL